MSAAGRSRRLFHRRVQESATFTAPRRARSPVASSGMSRLPHLAANVGYWSSRTAGELDLARRRWADTEPCWGIYDIPESVTRVLPADVTGLQVAELGCGTGYVSAWLSRAGAQPVAIDPTPSQLRIAQRMQDEIGPQFPLIRAAGEHVPLASASVDLVISEYGAAIWADPDLWIAEAARILRPGGELVFLGNSTLLSFARPTSTPSQWHRRCVVPYAGCTASVGPMTRPSSSTSPLATGSGSCAATASRSLTWSSSTHPTTRRVPRWRSHRHGQSDGRSRRCGALAAQPTPDRETTSRASACSSRGISGLPETLPPMGKHREPVDPDGPEYFNRRPLDGSAWLSELGGIHSDADRRLTGFSNELKAIFIDIHERYSDPQAAADLCETIIYRLCYDARSVYDPRVAIHSDATPAWKHGL